MGVHNFTKSNVFYFRELPLSHVCLLDLLLAHELPVCAPHYVFALLIEGS